jgi:hypothetical protein
MQIQRLSDLTCDWAWACATCVMWHDIPTWHTHMAVTAAMGPRQYRAGRSVALYDRLSIYTRSTNILGTLFIKRRCDQRYPRLHLLVTGVLRVMWYTSISACSANSPTHIHTTVDLSWRTVPWPGDQCLRGLGARPRTTRWDATRAAMRPMRVAAASYCTCVWVERNFYQKPLFSRSKKRIWYRAPKNDTVLGMVSTRSTRLSEHYCEARYFGIKILWTGAAKFVNLYEKRASKFEKVLQNQKHVLLGRYRKIAHYFAFLRCTRVQYR